MAKRSKHTASSTRKAMEQASGDHKIAAKVLGVSVRTLRRYLKKWPESDYETETSKRKFTEDDVIKAINESDTGFVIDIARGLGCSPTTFYRYMNMKDDEDVLMFPGIRPALDAKQAVTTRRRVDKAKSVIDDILDDEAIEAREKLPAATFILKHYDLQAKTRTTTEITLSQENIQWLEATGVGVNDVINAFREADSEAA